MIAMADGFAQATGGPALVNVHTGAGSGQCRGQSNHGVAEQDAAHRDCRPANARDAADGALADECRSTMLPRPWVKWAYEPVRAEDVPAAFMRAIATALQPPRVRSFSRFPSTIGRSHVPVPRWCGLVSQRFAPDPARLAEFAKILSEASSPF